MNTTTSNILDFPNEVLIEILNQVEGEQPLKLIGLDRRAYLSQESFRPPPPPTPTQAQEISNFRLVCKKFSNLGAIHQFSRVTTRFSRTGLIRLENIARCEHLAKHVKKFSYMVPYFYVEGRERVRELLPNLPESLGSLDVRHFIRKIAEQKDIVQSEEDVRVLKKALFAFSSLQHVQILRVQDQEDGMLLQYIRQNEHNRDLVELNWAPACSHSTKTLVGALLASRSPCSRFSSPMLSPQATDILVRPFNPFSTLAERLTCLELHFDDGSDLDQKMSDLSPTFKHVFTAAKNIEAVHVGFPSHRPLSLPFEAIFHHVRWSRLSAFGIQSWRLSAAEIIAMAGRHRDKLKGLRLRDVQLKDGSRWQDVLEYLHDEMWALDWVSLRRIGYTRHFDEQWAMGGEVPDDPPGGGSDSDDESDDWDPHAGSDYGHDDDEYNAPTSNHGDVHDGDISDSDSSMSHSDHDTEEGASGDAGMEFPPLSPDTPSSARWCNCNSHGTYPNSADELGDDGTTVGNMKRKMWEKWVIRRCMQHDTDK